MRRRTVRNGLVAVVIFLGMGTISFAVEPVIGRDQPRIIINNRGPLGRIYSLAFSNDSTKLFAGGSDKMIHAWDVGYNLEEIERGLPDKAVYLRSLHWEVNRGDNGKLREIAIHPFKKIFAVAGRSARNVGDIWIFNSENFQVVQALPQRRPDQSGHIHEVYTLDWSTDGESLLSVDLSGAVFRWQFEAKEWRGIQIKSAYGNLSGFKVPLLNLGATSFLTNHQFEPDGRLTLFSKTHPSGQFVSTGNVQESVATLAKLSTSYFAVTRDCKLLGGPLVDAVPGPLKQISLATTSIKIVTAAAISNNRLVLISGLDGSDNEQRTGMIELWYVGGNNTASMIWRTDLSDSSMNHAVAISKDGRRIAYTDRDGIEVIIQRLPPIINDENFSIAAFDNTKLVLGGRGKSWNNVGFSLQEPPELFLWRTVLDDGEETADRFDVTKGMDFGVQIPEDLAARKSNDSVTISRKQRGIFSIPFIEFASGKQIAWRDAVQGNVCAEALIVSPNEGKTIGLAIASDKTNEIYIYAYPSMKLVRRFRQHDNAPSNLAVSSDANFLASVAPDFTARIWDLRGAFDQPTPFVTKSNWGAELRLAGNGVEIATLINGGPIDFVGIKAGDRANYVRAPGIPQKKYAQEALAGMSSEDLLGSFEVGVQGKQPLMISPAWPALLTIYATNDEQWAAWRYDGYFNGSAAEGGELFSWQVNLGPGKAPEIFKADFLRHKFENPDLIKNIYAANTQRFAPVNDVMQSSAKIVLNHSVNDDGTATIEAIGDFSDASLPLLTMNGSPLRAPVVTGNKGRFTWKIPLTDVMNRVEVILNGGTAIGKRGAALSTPYFADKLFLRGQQSKGNGHQGTQPYKLHFVSLYSVGYSNTMIGGELLPPLTDHGDDEKILSKLEAVSKSGASVFTMRDAEGSFMLRNGDVNKANLERLINDLDVSLPRDPSERARHVVLLYLFGHGIVPEGEVASERKFYYVTTATKSDRDLSTQALSWSDIDKFGKLHCPVIVLLATCHSGAVLASKEAFAAAKRSGFYIFAAASEDQKAIQSTGEMGDYYSYFLRESLTDIEVDRDQNGLAQLHEVVDFVADKVWSKSEKAQRPRFYPSDLGGHSLTITRIK